MRDFDISLMPFSCAGSYLRISPLWVGKPGRLAIGCVRGRCKRLGTINLFEIGLFRGGREVAYEWNARPDRLVLRSRGGKARFAFCDPSTLRFTAGGVSLRLLPCHAASTVTPGGPGRCLIGDSPTGTFQHLRAGRGTTLKVHPGRGEYAMKGTGKDGSVVAEFSSKGTVSGAIRVTPREERWDEPLAPISRAESEQRARWRAWLAGMPEVPDEFRRAGERAWLLNWLCTVEPEGLMTRRAILMSKNWMTNVWSWDNCFNALAVASADPQLAWDQLLLMFDHQAPNGSLPDSVNDSELVCTFVKPPVYGWTVMGLVRTLGLRRCRRHIRQIYEPLGRLTDWWYTCRDYDNDGMCQYHHGNDSGWDNATAFDQGYPTEGADLAAHLVLQTEALAFMADVLGRGSEAAAWRERSHGQLAALLALGVKGNRFFSPLSGRRSARQTGSLLNYIPMVLGPRLPEPIRRRMVRDLSPGGSFLTEHGLATQAVDGPLYEPDGYWRGPIWAPSTYLIFDGLRQAGETGLARTVAERFCRMCAMQDGMYENYNALTGQGLRDPGYTWTASVFLLLANWLLAA